LEYIDKLSRECGYDFGENKPRFNRIILTLSDQLGILEIQDCETAEDYLNTLINVMKIDKKYPHA